MKKFLEIQIMVEQRQYEGIYNFNERSAEIFNKFINIISKKLKDRATITEITYKEN